MCLCVCVLPLHQFVQFAVTKIKQYALGLKQIEIPQEGRLSWTLKYTRTDARTSLSAWTSLKILLLEMNYSFVMYLESLQWIIPFCIQRVLCCSARNEQRILHRHLVQAVRPAGHV